MMKKIGLFGGSFDPIHNAHIDIAKNAFFQLGLDAIEFIPTQNNPWKEGAVASYQERVDMIQLAIKDYPYMSVNTIEKNQSLDKNYTIYTLELLTQENPQVEYYYIIGMDQANLFYKWKEAQKIDQLVHIVVFQRGGYKKNIDTHQNFHFTYLDNKPLMISSTAIKNGEIDKINHRVMRYISTHGIYLETMIRSRMKEKRYLHSLSVANLAKEIALANGLNGKQAYIAGLLHDIAKEMELSKATQLMKEHYSQFIDKPQPIWHQWLSCYVSQNEFFVDDKVILKAIETHTTGAVDMNDIGKCLYVADKLDPLRGYDSSESIQLCKQNIHEGFKQELIHFYQFSQQNKRDIDECFYEIYNKYVGKGEE